MVGSSEQKLSIGLTKKNLVVSNRCLRSLLNQLSSNNRRTRSPKATTIPIAALLVLLLILLEVFRNNSF